jgi:hypothetical protein
MLYENRKAGTVREDPNTNTHIHSEPQEFDDYKEVKSHLDISEASYG